MTSKARRERREHREGELARRPARTGDREVDRRDDRSDDRSDGGRAGGRRTGGGRPQGARRAPAGAAGAAAGLAPAATAGDASLGRTVGLAVGLCLAAIGVIVLVFGVLHRWYGLHYPWSGALHWVYGLHDISDTTIYFDYAGRMAHGFRPYVDFPVEYPPLAIPLFIIPGHTNSLIAYTDWFNVEMYAMLTGAAAATAAAAVRLWPKGRSATVVAIAFAACVLATGAIVGNRYDAAVALVLALFLLLMAYGKWTVACLVLGIGFALKLTPAIMLPLVFVLAVERRTILWGCLYFFLGAFLPFVPFLANGTKGLEYIFTYHLQRPLQVESVLATPLLFGSVIGKVWVEIGTAYGSQFVAATGATTLARLSGYFELIALAVTYWLIWQRRGALRARPGLVPLAVLAVILAFMTWGKVLSPQYFIWLLPAVALIVVERRVLGAVLVGVLLLTQIEFPAHYWTFIYLEHGSVMIVVVRNVLLVVAFGLSLWHLWRLPDAAGGSRLSPR